MRSSIACTKCRTSKVKCEHDGNGSACRACANAGRPCIFPEPGSGGQGRRASIVASREHPNGVEPKPKRQKQKHVPSFDDPYQKSGPNAADKALDFKVLTLPVWDELLVIFQQHFSMEFSFLHETRFKAILARLMQKSPSPDSGVPPTDDHGIMAAFLLAFLALTARFHKELIEQFGSGLGQGPFPSDSWALAESYARASRARLSGYSGDTPSLIKAQTNLMLGFHEFSAARAPEAYMDVSAAISEVQLLQLDLEWDQDEINVWDGASPITFDEKGGSTERSPQQNRIDQEIARRVLWSCFTLEQYMTDGKSKKPRLDPREVQAQLPGSMKIFNLGRNVKTMSLTETPMGFEKRTRYQRQQDDQARIPRETNGSTSRGNVDYRAYEIDATQVVQVDTNEDVRALWIRLMDIYGRIFRWMAKNGRRSGSLEERETPPWDPKSKFCQFMDELERFDRRLPSELIYSVAETEMHRTTSKESSTSYVHINVIRLLCRFLLRREWLPFLAPFTSYPKLVGPIDEPTFHDRNRYRTPPQYWEDNARKCFGAARDLTELLCTCYEWDTLPKTPLIVWATWNALFAGIYSYAFPHTDPNNDMSHPSVMERQPNGVPNYKAFGLLKQLHSELRSAFTWIHLASILEVFFNEIKEGGFDEVRHGPGGEKLWRYKYQQQTAALAPMMASLNLKSTTPEASNVRPSSQHKLGPDSMSPAHVKKEPSDKSTPASQVSGGFTAVNGGMQSQGQNPLVHPAPVGIPSEPYPSTSSPYPSREAQYTPMDQRTYPAAQVEPIQPYYPSYYPAFATVDESFNMPNQHSDLIYGINPSHGTFGAVTGLAFTGSHDVNHIGPGILFNAQNVMHHPPPPAYGSAQG